MLQYEPRFLTSRRFSLDLKTFITLPCQRVRLVFPVCSLRAFAMCEGKGVTIKVYKRYSESASATWYPFKHVVHKKKITHKLPEFSRARLTRPHITHVSFPTQTVYRRTVHKIETAQSIQWSENGHKLTSSKLHSDEGTVRYEVVQMFPQFNHCFPKTKEKIRCTVDSTVRLIRLCFCLWASPITLTSALTFVTTVCWIF